MFFFEWLIPLLAVMCIGTVLFYLSVKNRPGAGIRTDGTTFVDKSSESD
jgi:hypothetical protein